MKSIKRIFKVLIAISVILIAVNYFFAHLAFNHVMNNYAQTIIPSSSKISFKSYFSLLPSPVVHINNIDFEADDGGYMRVQSFSANTNLLDMIKTQTVNIDNITANGMALNLKKDKFDALLKKVVFQLIREGLGVINLSQNSIKKLNIKNVDLERINDGIIDSYHIASISYDSLDAKGGAVCFKSVDKAQQFYQKFIAQFLIAAHVKDDCILFLKPKVPLPIGKL